MTIQEVGHLRIGTRRAFSLVELLVAIAVIALLIAVALPVLSRARDAGRASVCLGRLRELASSVISYAGETDGLPASELLASTEHPDMMTLPKLFYAWNQGDAMSLMLRCPSDNANARPEAWASQLYLPAELMNPPAVNSFLRPPDADLVLTRREALQWWEDPSLTLPLWREASAFHQRGRKQAAYLDGSARAVPEQ